MTVWQHTRLLLGVAALAIGVGCGTDSVLAPVKPKEPAPPPVLSIAALSPLELEGMTGRPVTPTPRVQVTDEQGKPVAGVRVSFLVSGTDDRSGSYIQTPTSLTDLEGIATAGAWWLGWQSGVQELTASITGGARVIFRATALQEDFCAPAEACADADVAFVRHGAVFAVALPHSQPVKIADNARNPAWSPDGSRIAFGRPGPGQWDTWQLCVASADSEDVRCATGSFQGSVSRPSWSPDGSKLAFSVNSSPIGGNHPPLYILDVGSMTLQAVFTPSLGSVSWSPDGRTLAFADGGALGVMNPDGSGRKIVARLELGDFSVSEVVWSPDGQQLAATLRNLTVCPWDCDMAIGVMNADGTGLRLLASSSSQDGEFLADPVWSPDGRRIAFTFGEYSPAHRSAVLVVSVGGGTPQVLMAHSSSLSWRR